MFGERVAQGMLVLSLALGLLPLAADKVVAVRRLSDVTFSRPVRIGDTIRVRCRVRGLKPIDQHVGVVVHAWEVVNQSDEVTMRAAVDLVWRRG